MVIFVELIWIKSHLYHGNWERIYWLRTFYLFFYDSGFSNQFACTSTILRSIRKILRTFYCVVYKADRMALHRIFTHIKKKKGKKKKTQFAYLILDRKTCQDHLIKLY